MAYKQCIGYTYVIFDGFVSLGSIFLLSIRMALSSVISLDEMKSLVLTKKKTNQEISNILNERHPDMRGLSEMNVRRFCNENGIRTRAFFDDSETQKMSQSLLLK